MSATQPNVSYRQLEEILSEAEASARSELATLKAENDRLREALKEIIKWEEELDSDSAVLKIARKALEAK